MDGESVPDHMYRMALLAMTLPELPEGVDRQKAIQMCLVHDLAEALVGDITPECGIPQARKQQMELTAMQKITACLPEEQAAHLQRLFEEYERGESVTARFVKDLDRIEFLLQTKAYEERYGMQFPDFYLNSVDKIHFKHLLTFFGISKPTQQQK